MRAVGTLLFGGRIPAMAPDEVAFELAAGDATITGVAFAGGAYGIAGDARAGDPSLVVLADEDALLARLHEELHAHLGRCSRRSPRRPGGRCARCGAAPATGWAARSCGSARSWGMRERAWDLGTRCMQAGGPLAVGAGFRVIEHAGIAEPTRNRRSCCLIWRAEGQDTCFTCPLTTDGERRARLAGAAPTPRCVDELDVRH